MKRVKVVGLFEIYIEVSKSLGEEEILWFMYWGNDVDVVCYFYGYKDVMWMDVYCDLIV